LRFVKDDTLRSRYRQQLSRIIGARGFEPHILFIYAIKVAMHYHFAAIAHALAQVEDANGSMPDAGRSFSRGRKQPTEAQALASRGTQASHHPAQHGRLAEKKLVG